MVLTVVVTIISVVIIFVDAGRWTKVRPNFHAMLVVVSAQSFILKPTILHRL